MMGSNRWKGIAAVMCATAMAVGLGACSMSFSCKGFEGCESTPADMSQADRANAVKSREWPRFVTEEQGYSIDFPGMPKREDGDGDDDRAVRYMFSMEDGWYSFAVLSTPVSHDGHADGASKDRTWQDIVDYAEVRGVSESDFSEKNISGRIGATFQTVVNDGNSEEKDMYGALVSNGKTIYLIQSVDRPQEEFDRFLDSFQLL